jgi:hypothetical protein
MISLSLYLLLFIIGSFYPIYLLIASTILGELYPLMWSLSFLSNTCNAALTSLIKAMWFQINEISSCVCCLELARFDKNLSSFADINYIARAYDQ